jgi:hypothetical protein
MAVDVDQVLDELDTEDYAAFSASRDTQPSGTEDEEAPAAGKEQKPTSESDDAEQAETGQTAEESETEEEEQQEEDDEEKAQDKPKGKRGIDRRFGKLTGKIAALESRLAELGESPAEGDEEVAEEVASSPEKATEDPTAEKLVRPKLRDFEDNDEASAWDQYEQAIEAYDRKLEQKQEQKIAAALAEQKQKLELEHATATANAAWSKAASRFSDYDDVVSDKTQISQAMESVMRMDAESGTALAYWLGKHPEESLRIAKSTLARNEQEWTDARIRASFELGKIRAQLTEPGKEKPKSPTAASPPTTKQVTRASKPPTVIRGGTAPPQTDVLNEDDAADYNRWLPAREAQVKRK